MPDVEAGMGTVILETAKMSTESGLIHKSHWQVPGNAQKRFRSEYKFYRFQIQMNAHTLAAGVGFPPFKRRAETVWG